ncbi:hypothetical protein BSPWISOXPB_5034 [uncultured Gammaproteobacteria bacterium]|nr:hypothetical protein BSPWISOXPB_5034 [uncultured Gammaproteobacteria bacterium]
MQVNKIILSVIVKNQNGHVKVINSVQKSSFLINKDG